MTWRVCASIITLLFRVLRRCQHAAVAGKGGPGAERLDYVADDGRLVAQNRLSKPSFQPRGHGLCDPGAAADIDRVTVGMIEEGAAAELIGEPHMVASLEAVEVRRCRRFRAGAD